MRRRRMIIVTCLVAVLSGGLAAEARAENPAVVDCNHHNMLTRSYSVARLRNALATMPPDVREYTSCYQVIDDQLLRQLGQKIPGGAGVASTSSGGSLISTPLLIVVIVIVLGGGAGAYVAYRRRP